MNEVVKKTCQEALKQYGVEKQVIKCVEELSELQKELCRLLLGKGNRENIVEEIIDVEIMIEQMKIGLNLGFYELTKAKALKIERLNERLKGE